MPESLGAAGEFHSAFWVQGLGHSAASARGKTEPAEGSRVRLDEVGETALRVNRLKNWIPCENVSLRMTQNLRERHGIVDLTDSQVVGEKHLSQTALFNGVFTPHILQSIGDVRINQFALAIAKQGLMQNGVILNDGEALQQIIQILSHPHMTQKVLVPLLRGEGDHAYLTVLDQAARKDIPYVQATLEAARARTAPPFFERTGEEQDVFLNRSMDWMQQTMRSLGLSFQAPAGQTEQMATRAVLLDYLEARMPQREAELKEPEPADKFEEDVLSEPLDIEQEEEASASLRVSLGEREEDQDQLIPTGAEKNIKELCQLFNDHAPLTERTVSIALSSPEISQAERDFEAKYGDEVRAYEAGLESKEHEDVKSDKPSQSIQGMSELREALKKMLRPPPRATVIVQNEVEVKTGEFEFPEEEGLSYVGVSDIWKAVDLEEDPEESEDRKLAEEIARYEEKAASMIPTEKGNIDLNLDVISESAFYRGPVNIWEKVGLENDPEDDLEDAWALRRKEDDRKRERLEAEAKALEAAGESGEGLWEGSLDDVGDMGLRQRPTPTIAVESEDDFIRPRGLGPLKTQEAEWGEELGEALEEGLRSIFAKLGIY